MPGIFNKARVRAAGESRVLRYLLYASGEVLLIFVGISLAVAFDNSVEAGRQRDLTRGILGALEQNLTANIAELELNLEVDSVHLESISSVLEHLAARDQWVDSLDADLADALRWTSPFFHTSAYDNLRQSGLHLVEDPQLRSDIVGLFETTYGRLIGDLDRSMWVYMESVTNPYRARALLRTDQGGEWVTGLAPRDYRAARERGELRTMLLDLQFFLMVGRGMRGVALEDTREVRANVSEYLETIAEGTGR